MSIHEHLPNKQFRELRTSEIVRWDADDQTLTEIVASLLKLPSKTKELRVSGDVDGVIAVRRRFISAILGAQLLERTRNQMLELTSTLRTCNYIKLLSPGPKHRFNRIERLIADGSKCSMLTKTVLLQMNAIW